MGKEVTLLREKIEDCQILSRGGCEIYTGTINGDDVVLNQVLVKLRAAIGTTLLFEHFRPDVINAGQRVV